MLSARSSPNRKESARFDWRSESRKLLPRRSWRPSRRVPRASRLPARSASLQMTSDKSHANAAERFAVEAESESPSNQELAGELHVRENPRVPLTPSSAPPIISDLQLNEEFGAAVGIFGTEQRKRPCTNTRPPGTTWHQRDDVTPSAVSTALHRPAVSSPLKRLT